MNNTKAKSGHSIHCVDTLREHCKQLSQRPYIARGSNALRCPSCLMATFACFCHHRQPTVIPIEFILLFHRDEIHKPTNSGRLIADLFPTQTHAFLWHRTDPDRRLVALLNNRKGHCSILFPDTVTARQQNRPMHNQPPPINKEGHTFIILDGTWKQASKMFHQSHWLKGIPYLAIQREAQKSFQVRHAKHDGQFATAEAVSMLLDTLHLPHQSDALFRYYQIFNQHCMMSRKRG